MNYINITNHKTNSEDVLLSELDSLINGSIPNIHCYILDSLAYDDRIIKTISLFKKLANKGTLTIKFWNYAKATNDYLLGKISSKKMSTLINGVQSIQNEGDIHELASENRQMKIIKSYYENDNVIVVIEKNL